MQEKSKVIFGNEISNKAYKNAVKSKKKYIRKFGDDTNKDYPVRVEKNRYIGDSLGVCNILVGDLNQNAHYDGDHPQDALEFDTEKGIIVGTIRM